MADIKKAFLQISINEKDCDYLKFLWVDEQHQQVVFRHKRVVFGLISSPFPLGATLEYHLSQCHQRCSVEEVITYSQDIVKRLARSFYVDNCVTSLPDEDAATKFIKEWVEIMAEGQFELRGWERAHDGPYHGNVCPVLGVNWQPQTDVLTISQKFLGNNNTTSGTLSSTIGVRLFTQVYENLTRKVDCFFWSDSSTVISWIQRKEEWAIFVGNRVAEIRKLTLAERWYHIPGTSNPADLPSRGCSLKQLLESKWWEGPNWLYEDPEIWPFSNFDNNEEEISAERKKNLVSTLLSVDNINTLHLNHFSGHNKMIRMIAWIFRFLHNCRRSGEDIGELTAQEYQTAENFVIKLIQQECFSNENK
ncbi:hypothetical protein NQ315_017520 [Exocentrus adspersus]|uniref:Uncharacterized protein n=1 Tax=Exocentrus adspersus TaxID=1586481 RepID=A0AAV8VJQ0_9CUCU|nr:hypothetical protein NQ315_017520 [Exocentrus adspersus]